MPFSFFDFSLYFFFIPRKIEVKPRLLSSPEEEKTTFIEEESYYLRGFEDTKREFILSKTDLEGRERKVAIVLLGSENHKTDTQKIYLWLLENYFKL